MQIVYPVSKESCKPFCGKPVLIYLHDGAQIQGILSRVEKGRIILNERSTGTSDERRKGRLAKTKNSVKKGRAAKTTVNTGGFSPHPYQYGFVHPFPYGPLIDLDLASIAVLFPL